MAFCQEKTTFIMAFIMAVLVAAPLDLMWDLLLGQGQAWSQALTDGQELGIKLQDFA